MILHMHCRWSMSDGKGLNGYLGFTLEGDNYDTKVFNTGDPVADFRAVALAGFEEHKQGNVVMYSSDVDFFCTDVDGYHWEVDKDGQEWIVKDA